MIEYLIFVLCVLLELNILKLYGCIFDGLYFLKYTA